MNYTLYEQASSRAQSAGRNARCTHEFIVKGVISASAWDSGTTYAVNNIVKRSNGSVTEEFVSLAGSNTNHDPLTSPTWWERWAELGAEAALEAGTPVTYNGMLRTAVDVTPVRVIAVPDSNPTMPLLFEGTVTYEPFDWSIPATGAEEFRGQTGGATQHITQSIQTRNAGAISGRTAPNYDRAIGVTSDSVEGVDIYVSQVDFTVTKYFASVTNDYFYLLRTLTGKVNLAAFTPASDGPEFAAGELLLVNVEWYKRKNEDWQFVFHYQAGENVKQVVIGDSSIVIGNGSAVVKYAWDYVWTRYEDMEDSSAKKIVKKPLAAYVEQVYTALSWTNLYNNSYTAAP